MELGFDKAVKWLSQLLEIDSVEGEALFEMPFGKGVNDCLLYALSLLRSLGFETKNIEGYCGYGEIGQGELFGILCHLDVVPVGEGWTKPPFGAEIHDNKLYGRGALDDKGPFIACLYAAARLLAEGRVPKKRIRFILGCDEESGWLCMERYMRTEEMPKEGISPDADFPVIHCEKGVLYHTVAHPLPEGLTAFSGGTRPNVVPNKAYARAKVTDTLLAAAKEGECRYTVADGEVELFTEGVSCHGSHPEDGSNAILKLLKILKEQYPAMQEIYHAFSHHTGSGAGLDLSDEESGSLTMNLGTVKIDAENGTVVYEVDIRYPISYDKDAITSILKKRLRAEVKQGAYHLPLYVPKEHPLVQTLLRAYRRVTGEEAEPIAVGGATYARVLPLGVAFGPCFPNGNSGIHCPDEYIDLADFEKAAEIYYYALKEICF